MNTLSSLETSHRHWMQLKIKLYKLCEDLIRQYFQDKTIPCPCIVLESSGGCPCNDTETLKEYHAGYYSIHFPSDFNFENMGKLIIYILHHLVHIQEYTEASRSFL